METPVEPPDQLIDALRQLAEGNYEFAKKKDVIDAEGATRAILDLAASAAEFAKKTKSEADAAESERKNARKATSVDKADKAAKKAVAHRTATEELAESSKNAAKDARARLGATNPQVDWIVVATALAEANMAELHAERATWAAGAAEKIAKTG